MKDDKTQMARYPLPSNARCEVCGSADLSAIPKFFTGMGTASVPFNEAVLCRKCGHSGAFALVNPEGRTGSH